MKSFMFTIRIFILATADLSSLQVYFFSYLEMHVLPVTKTSIVYKINSLFSLSFLGLQN